jgi:hypothetical protein
VINQQRTARVHFEQRMFGGKSITVACGTASRSNGPSQAKMQALAWRAPIVSVQQRQARASHEHARRRTAFGGRWFTGTLTCGKERRRLSPRRSPAPINRRRMTFSSDQNEPSWFAYRREACVARSAAHSARGGASARPRTQRACSHWILALESGRRRRRA